MPRPRATAASLAAPGDGRDCHFIILATRFDQLDAARIFEAAQAKLDRVDARRSRQFVGEALDRETIGRLAG
jgi:hypothetical protein